LKRAESSNFLASISELNPKTAKISTIRSLHKMGSKKKDPDAPFCLDSLAEGRYVVERHELYDFASFETETYSPAPLEWIPCRDRGEISIYDYRSQRLILKTNIKTGKKVLQEVEGAELSSTLFEDECSIFFTPNVFHKIAEIAGAERREKSVSHKSKAKFIEAGKPYRFKRKS
jgi:hypothetical protein